MPLSGWWVPGSAQLYKWMPAEANYDPDSPWVSKGRFGDGTYKTLYLAESAEAAVAEYLRRYPEFFDLQESLVIGIYAIQIEVRCRCVDVRTQHAAVACGIAPERLVSSETDESVRYAECRLLAGRVMDAAGAGIAYPSAAASWGQWNLVLFGDADETRWVSKGVTVVPRPELSRSQVTVLALPGLAR